MLLSLLLRHVLDELFLYQLAATLITFSVLRIALFIRVRRRRFQLLRYYGIPGPEPRLLDGSLLLYTNSKATFLVDLEFQRKYGNVFGFYIGDQANVVITDVELLRKIFFEETSSFKERLALFIDTPLSDSVILARHDRWKAMRKIISPAFSAYSMRGQDSTNFIDETVKQLLDYIENKLETPDIKDPVSSDTIASHRRATVDIHDLMKASALKLITGLAIHLPGIEVKEGESHVESLDAFVSQASSGAIVWSTIFPLFSPILSFISRHVEHGKTLSSLWRELNKTIDEGLIKLASPGGEKTRSTPSKRPQLIDTLVKLHYEGKLSREEVLGNAEALLLAGYDTTSTTLSYIFWVLGKHPEIQEKLRGELMAHGVESSYLGQVIDETMRLYPTVIAFTTRMATENVTIDDLTIPSGTKVVYNAWLMHRNPDLWPEPEKFDPERFRDGVQIHPCAFAPFGLGERKCLGFSLAQLELKTVVCDLLCRYRVITKTPMDLVLHTHGFSVLTTYSSEKIIIELERL